MHVRIVGIDLPGTRSDHADDPAGGGDHGVCVGVQRGREVEQLVPASADRAVFDLELRPKGDQDAVGPYAQGRPGERFVYLVWVQGPDREMFRRAKLMLADIPPEVWEAGVAGATIEGELGLTDDCGQPLCARVAPGRMTWRIA